MYYHILALLVVKRKLSWRNKQNINTCTSCLKKKKKKKKKKQKQQKNILSRALTLLYFSFISCKKKVQSTVIISKSKGLSEIL